MAWDIRLPLIGIQKVTLHALAANSWAADATIYSSDDNALPAHCSAVETHGKPR